MSAAGLASLYPAQGLSSIGFGTVIAKLPLLLRRMRETVDAIVAAPPDVLVLIDAPDFTHRMLTACGGGCRICRSSNTWRRASGSGGPGAHAQCAPRSISCSPCCRSSPRCIVSWAVRTASMSGTPCSSISPICAPPRRRNGCVPARRRWCSRCRAAGRMRLSVLP